MPAFTSPAGNRGRLSLPFPFSISRKARAALVRARLEAAANYTNYTNYTTNYANYTNCANYANYTDYADYAYYVIMLGAMEYILYNRPLTYAKACDILIVEGHSGGSQLEFRRSEHEKDNSKRT